MTREESYNNGPCCDRLSAVHTPVLSSRYPSLFSLEAISEPLCAISVTEIEAMLRRQEIPSAYRAPSACSPQPHLLTNLSLARIEFAHSSTIQMYSYDRSEYCKKTIYIK